MHPELFEELGSALNRGRESGLFVQYDTQKHKEEATAVQSNEKAGRQRDYPQIQRESIPHAIFILCCEDVMDRSLRKEGSQEESKEVAKQSGKKKYGKDHSNTSFLFFLEQHDLISFSVRVFQLPGRSMGLP
jgi:hypothetical protein